MNKNGLYAARSPGLRYVDYLGFTPKQSFSSCLCCSDDLPTIRIESLKRTGSKERFDRCALCVTRWTPSMIQKLYWVDKDNAKALIKTLYKALMQRLSFGKHRLSGKMCLGTWKDYLNWAAVIYSMFHNSNMS